MRRAGYEPLQPYSGRNTPWLCRCSCCGHEMTRTLGGVADKRTGSPCPYCSGRIIDPDDAHRIMCDAGYEPLGPYPGNKVDPWPAKCRTCGRQVTPPLISVLQGKRCLFCGYQRSAEVRRVDPDTATSEMRAAGLEPLGPYPGGRTAWLCSCLECGNEVTTTLTRVRNRGRQCRFCGTARSADLRRRPAAEAERIMRAAGVEPLEPYRSALLPWRCRCFTCGREVTPRFNDVRKGSGACAYCGSRAVDPSEAEGVMRRAGFEPLTPYPGALSRRRCRYTTCGNESTPAYASVHNGSRCRFCSEHGFSYGEPGVVYVVTHPIHGAHKVGIAAPDSDRLAVHRRNGWQVYRTLLFDRGEDAFKVEQAVLRWLRDDLGLPPFLAEGIGWTETVGAEAVSLPALWRMVLSLSAASRSTPGGLGVAASTRTPVGELHGTGAGITDSAPGRVLSSG